MKGCSKMKWSALSEALDITTEMRPVHRAGKRGFLTKDAAIRDAIKGIARSLDYCDCAPREPDTMYGSAKRLPDSQAEWEEKTSEEFWGLYEFQKEEEEET